jgi:hypothetical protein
MAISRVSGSHAEVQYDVSGAARTLVSGGTLSSASLLVTGMSRFNVGVTVTIADSVNGSWTEVGTYADLAGNSFASTWFFANNASTGTPTLTSTPSGASYQSFSFEEFSGVATVSPLRVSDGTFNTSSNPVVTPSILTVAGDLVFAVFNAQGTAATAVSVNAPFALITNLAASGTFEGLIVAWGISSGGSLACTFTLSGSNSGSTIISAFKPATDILMPQIVM